VQGEPYSASLVTAGSFGAVHWSLVSGSLPTGLGLASDGTISGVPTGVTSTFVVEASDSSLPVAQTSTKSLTLTVLPAQKLAITAPTTISASQGASLHVVLTASGGESPYKWAVSSGALPSGLSLSSAGVLSGEPTASGSTTLGIQVTDSLGSTPQTATEQFTVVVHAADPLSISSLAIPGATVGSQYRFTLGSEGGVGPYAWVIQSGSLPPGLSLATDGTISGQPTQSGRSAFTVTVTDSDTPVAQSSSQSLSIVVVGSGEVSVSSVLPSGTEGSYYSGNLTASGGTGPYTWTLSSGSLPAGLNLEPGGVVYGTPTGAGATNLTFQATDRSVPPNVVLDPESIVILPAPDLSINSPSIPTGTQGTFYDTNLQATGGVGPYSWSVGAGALPSGLSLSATGQLAGTSTDSGEFDFTVVATDSATPMPDTASVGVALTMIAASPLSVVTTSLGPGTQAKYYEASLAATGGIGEDTWTLASGSSLPQGLHLFPLGYLYGTPTASGTSTFTVEVTDSASPTPDVTSAALTLTIAAPPPLTITTTSLDSGVQGSYISTPLQATGGVGDDTWVLSSGSLPQGLTLDPSGYLYGTPTASGTSTFTVEVTDSASPTPDVTSAALTLTIVDRSTLAILTKSLSPAVQGSYFTQSIQKSGGSGSDTWSVVSGSLPTGLAISNDGYLSGVPTSSGTFVFTVQVTDGATPNPDMASLQMTLVVSPAAALSIEPLPQPSAVQGASYTSQLSASGGVGPYTWSFASGPQPAGLSLDSAGELTGFPTGTGVVNVPVTVTDSATPIPTTTTAVLALTLSPSGPLTVSSTALPAGTEGNWYSGTLEASGGIGPFTWKLATGSLPPGLSLDPSGSIVGVPTRVGTTSFTVAESDSLGAGSIGTESISVGTGSPLSITTSSLPTGVQGSNYNTTTLASLASTGGAGPYTWSVAAGSLPTGMRLGSNGELFGVPSAPGTYLFTAEVTDSESPTPDVAAKGLSITVAPGALLQIEQSTLPSGTEGSAYSSTVSASGGVGEYTWSVTSGTLPSGLTLESPFGSTTAFLYGTPTQSGVFNFSIAATDSATPTPDVSTQAFSLTVSPAGPLHVVSTSLVPGTQGVSYSSNLQAAGGIGPYTWSVTSGGLPTGLTLSASGLISGEPTVSGTFSFMVQATDSAFPTPAVAVGSESMVITAAGPLQIGTETLASATAGTYYDSSIGVSGGIGPFKWSISSGALPAGLYLTGYGEYATVFGTPAVSGTFTFSAQVTDSASPTPNVSALSFSLVVKPPGPLEVLSSSLPSGTQGGYYSDVLQASGGIGPYVWTVTAGNLPEGLELSPSGYLSGYPTESGTFTFTAQVTDSSLPNSVTASVPLSLVLGSTDQLSITSPSALQGTQGTYLETGLEANGGFLPYSWALTAGSLPSGVSLNGYGYLTGTPTQSGIRRHRLRQWNRLHSH
jgi:hypothetical protein